MASATSWTWYLGRCPEDMEGLQDMAVVRGEVQRLNQLVDRISWAVHSMCEHTAVNKTALLRRRNARDKLTGYR